MLQRASEDDPMSHRPQQPPPANSPAAPDPVPQPRESDGDDATSGAEGGGPRVGYSEPKESERLKFPKPVTPRPDQK